MSPSCVECSALVGKPGTCGYVASRRQAATRARRVTADVEDAVVEARRQHPRWGPVLLRAWLIARYPRRVFPSASCIGAILKRRGLTAPKRARRYRERIEVSPPFPSSTAPNQVWAMDFKRWFRMLDTSKCYPFTLLDTHSRFLLRCIGLLEPNGEHVMRILDSAFREYGLPKRIRSDGGPPFFAATSPATLSRVSVWLLRLGVTLECIAPAKPQQNGRLERFHGTLKREVVIANSIAAQQRELDEFRRRYNFERPHTALDLHPPWTVYRRSSQKYPRALIQTSARNEHCEQIDRSGFLRWRKQRVFVGEVFAGDDVTIWSEDKQRWAVHLGAIRLGHFDANKPERFVRTKRSRGPMRLSLEAMDGWEPINES